MSVEVKDSLVMINTKKRKYLLDRDEICYIESVGKRLFIYTMDECCIAYGSLCDIEDKLGPLFTRCHRSYLVNLNHIAYTNGRSLYMDNKDVILVARDKLKDFLVCLSV